MIEAFVKRWEAGKDQLRASLTEHPSSYSDLVKSVIMLVTGDDEYNPDPERIHTIDDGDYQGTLLFVIAAKGYQPSTYWYVYVGYGSCSGCDTLQRISDYRSDAPTEDQKEQYMTLALHIVQGLKEME